MREARGRSDFTHSHACIRLVLTAETSRHGVFENSWFVYFPLSSYLVFSRAFTVRFLHSSSCVSLFCWVPATVDSFRAW